ncbi:MAG: polysaccharide deacetylase family protein [Candidatus Daviesbacteria bacterium]|nr:polysaccharide deacetylase family protein [Candidatus Daviesbacteria bacterium]
MNRGIFCISLDMEMMWGRHDLPNYREFIKRADKERVVIKKLLNLFDKYQIPATWAVVGHLFLDHCFPDNGSKHPDVKRPNPKWTQNDWFENDPTSSLENDPQWYGLDIVKLIQQYKNQEVGSHSFSHIIFGDEGTSYSAAESDLKKCIELAKKNGIKFSSFVFPRNSVGYLGLLKKYGFRAFRGPQPNLKKGIIAKLFQALDLFLPISPPISKPLIHDELLNIPSSMYFVSARGIRKFIPRNTRSRKAISGIKKAIDENGVFHLWTHPTDFADNTKLLLEDFEDILKYADLKRKAGLLEIKNMQQITIASR